ncbi:MAG: hydrogenase, partial [Bryobacterales bacterium]|nr:hydrogenase [Bryobacterales bacterium]
MEKELVQKSTAIGITQDPVIGPGHDYTSVTDKISSLVLTTKIHKEWLIGFLFSASLASLLGVSMYYLLFKGIGVWGPNVPVGWGFD